MVTANRNIEPGFEIPTISKFVTFEKMQLYEPGVKNLHTDVETAKKAGLPGPIIGGQQSYAYLSEMLMNFFGEGWVKGGKIAVSLVKIVPPGDTLTGKGVVKEKVNEGDKVRLVLDIWLENQNGEKAVVGTASGLVN